MATAMGQLDGTESNYEDTASELQSSVESGIVFSSSIYVPHNSREPHRSLMQTGRALSGYFSEDNGFSGSFDSLKEKSPLLPRSVTRATTQECWTGQQKATLVSVLFVDFCACLCISILAPFFPKEAEKKGINPTGYGFVFGIFSFFILILSPIYGKYIGYIGPKLLFNLGTVITGFCIISFGMLEYVPAGAPFLTCAMVIRVLGAFGDCAIFCASYVIMPQVFPNSVATVFAAVESAFALGLIAGPALGGLLYEVGGYSLPFIVNGSCLILSAVVTYFVLPNIPAKPCSASLLKMLKCPFVILYGLVTYSSAFSGGFIAAVLQPHLAMFGLPPALEGLMFAINGVVYAIAAPIFGRYCDKSKNFDYICLFSLVVMMFSYLLLGPADFMPMEPSIWMTVAALMLYGVGWAGELIAAAAGITAETINNGYPDSVETYGLVSGLINAMFALGACTGPILGGALFEGYGFRASSMVVFYLHLVVTIILGGFTFYRRRRRSIEDQHRRSSIEEDPTSV